MSSDETRKIISVRVISFKEFLSYLPINSIGDTWLSYEILWYASKCIAIIKKGEDHRNIRALFSARLAEIKEFQNFSEIATDNWSKSHKEMFETIAFQASSTNLVRFQRTAAEIHGVDLGSPEIKPLLGWEEFNREVWTEEFFKTVAELLVGNNISYAEKVHSPNFIPSPPSDPERDPASEDGRETTSESEETQTDEDGTPLMARRSRPGEYSKFFPEMDERCSKIASMMASVQSNMEGLARLSSAVKMSLETGFSSLCDPHYNAHGNLILLLKRSWDCLPATMQVATPKVLVDVMVKDPMYRILRDESQEDGDRLVIMETIWNNHMLRLIHDSGNFDEHVSKSRLVRVDEVANLAAQRTLAAAGMDDSWPSLIRGLSNEIKQMNIQQLSTSKATSTKISIPGSVVAKNDQEARRLLGLKKAEVKTAPGGTELDIRERYLKMSDFELISLSPEERAAARKIRKEASRKE